MTVRNKDQKIPIIDLFAGPGGLGEGFSQAGFDIRLSIECDPEAHQTLQLRAFCRELVKKKGGIDSLTRFFESGAKIDDFYNEHPSLADHVRNEAWLARLGETPNSEVDARIRNGLRGAKKWVLIGGPPCKAYSLAGRARMRGTNPSFEDDHRHFLYKEYLRIVEEHRPTVFVMEM